MTSPPAGRGRSPHLAARPRVRTVPLLAVLVAAGAAPAAAQNVDDGLLLPARTAGVAVEYGQERWHEYWEGTRLRSNDNLGTLTTRRATAWAGYGLSDRLSVVATIPYVWTEASQGVLRSMHGAQDVTVALKYRVLQARVADRAAVRALAVVGAGAPTTDYTPDFLPLSIGLGSRRALARGAVHVQDRSGWFADGSAGHTWRSTVHLDRPAYFTDGRLVLSDEVAMPDVFDYVVGGGWQGRRLCIPVSLAGQRTLGGGDIRRQDMPFVSNRMDFTRVQARVAYELPMPRAVTVSVGGMRTLAGRNVGRATMLTGGVAYAHRF
jgi:hypothetical protein